jgi:hypothetical protein
VNAKCPRNCVRQRFSVKPVQGEMARITMFVDSRRRLSPIFPIDHGLDPIACFALAADPAGHTLVTRLSIDPWVSSHLQSIRRGAGLDLAEVDISEGPPTESKLRFRHLLQIIGAEPVSFIYRLYPPKSWSASVAHLDSCRYISHSAID